MLSFVAVPAKQSLLLFLLTLAVVPSGNAAVITIKTSGGTYSPVTRRNVQAAWTAASCGDEIQIEAGSTVRTGAEVTQVQVNGIQGTITFPYVHDFVTGDFLRV